jgi:hypothetical protein
MKDYKRLWIVGLTFVLIGTGRLAQWAKATGGQSQTGCPPCYTYDSHAGGCVYQCTSYQYCSGGSCVNNCQEVQFPCWDDPAGVVPCGPPYWILAGQIAGTCGGMCGYVPCASDENPILDYRERRQDICMSRCCELHYIPWPSGPCPPDTTKCGIPGTYLFYLVLATQVGACTGCDLCIV